MESKKSKQTKSINVCYGVYLNQIEMAKNGLLSTDDFGKLVIAMYDYEVNDIEPDLSESTPQFQIAWSCCKPSVTKRKRKKGYNQKQAEKKKAQEMAQNEEIIEKEYNYTTSTINAPIYPTFDSKNQEYNDFVIADNVEDENQEVMDDFARLLDSDDKYLRSNTFDDCFFEHKEIMNFVVMSGLTNEPFIKVFNEKKIA